MSPSSVDKAPKATQSGNAHIHGMTQVTHASIAYISAQVGPWVLTLLLASTQCDF